MEIDFLIIKNKIISKHNVMPIEVKSGKDYATETSVIFIIDKVGNIG